MTETDAEPPTPPTSAPRRWDWRRGTRWFGAEFLVVVTGVLVALALNAWWANRQDRSKERFYLRQLVADLAETERASDQMDRRMVPFERAPRRLAQAYFLTNLPPRDSIVAWASVAPVHFPISPVLGTVEAMVTTGDIGLVRDDSLRIAIVSYLDETRSNIRGYHEWQQLLLQHTSMYGSLAPVAEVFADQIGPSALDSLDRADLWRVLVPPGVDIEPFDAAAFVRDQQIQRLMVNITATKDNMRLYRGSFRSDAAVLRERVEAALGE